MADRILPLLTDDRPVCQESCPSFTVGTTADACDADPEHRSADEGAACLPYLIADYRRNRERARLGCRGCARGKRDSGGNFVGWCTWRNVGMENDDYCNGWEQSEDRHG